MLLNYFKGKKTNKIIKNIIKYGKAGGTPKSSVKEYYNGKIPFLSISDMTKQGKYIYNTERNISEIGLKNSSAWLVPEDSIILSMYASYGLVAINKIKLSTSQAMFNMILNDNVFVEYIYQYLNYLNISNYYDKLISTGTQSNLNAEKIYNIKIFIPEFNEQKLIANLLNCIDILI
ncbi:MAG TPA: restriction endonuclease subunit S, partial [Candidatus Faecisoma merdavium]|nr:restriction endonuclease subunit S [Candidatus Faecisoma merdavium]